jgi:adenylate cyclase class IV
MIELEVKAVVPDPDVLRDRLRAARALPGFSGLMEDRRFDRDGALLARDEVLRVRRFRTPEGAVRARVSWKGPVSVDRGYKRRPELEYAVSEGDPAAVFEALGYDVTEGIDRMVEYYELGGATLRIEWYPRMDVLLEVEGSPDAIETAVEATGIPRADFTPEALAEFVARYEARVGRPAATSVGALGDEPPAWPGQ